MSGPKTTERLLRGYGPLVGFAAIFLAISMLVPTVRQEVTSTNTSASAATPGFIDPNAPVDMSAGDVASSDPAAGDTTSSLPAEGGSGPAGGVGGPAGARAGQTTVKGAGGSVSGTPGAKSNSVGGVTPCPGRQVPGDPYSPPCFKFSGDNFGATSPGVTADKVTVSIRSQTFDNGLLDAISKAAGAKIPNESRAKINNTLYGIVEYINKTYEFYGRKLALNVYDGQGEVEKELLGGGQEGAKGDALKVASEIKAFADAGGITPPYADALAGRKIISVGAPYVSRQWLTARRPYAWSPLTDCTTVVESAASYYLAKLAGKPAAYAGGSLTNQPRRTAILAPENSWYQECAAAGQKLISDAGKGAEIVLNTSYKLDINQMAPQATSLIAKLKSQNITTVICGCDPLILVFLTGKAREQQYQPEWVETGVALTDQDLVGQIFDQQAWNKAFGVSFAGPPQAIQAGIGYRAFKAMRPNEEPSIAADLMYYQLQMVAIGVQMAGPNLTPESFEQGMFRYPSTAGPFGTWKFGPGDYTTSQDAKEVYWDKDAISAQTGDPGTWVDPNGGKRYPIGQFPPGEPNVPR